MQLNIVCIITCVRKVSVISVHPRLTRRSLMYNRNNNGPKIVPWGTPQLNKQLWESEKNRSPRLPPFCSVSFREGRVALSVGHPRGTHSRYVIGCCLIPLEICGVKNNSKRITYGIGCIWGMPSLSPLQSLEPNSFNSSNVGKLDCIEVQEKKKKVVVLCWRSPQSVNLGRILTSQSSLYWQQTNV